MKTFYICTKNVLQQFWNTHFREWHGTELPDGRMIIAVKEFNANKLDEWLQHPEVEELPHPMSGDIVSTKHHGALKHLGVLPTDNMHKISKKLAKVNPLMAL